jgi:hypothetical protein
MTIFYSSYRDQVFQNLGRDDSKTGLKVMSAFNMAQDLISWFETWESLQDTITVETTPNLYTFSKSDWGVNDLWRVYSMFLRDSTRGWWILNWISTLRWDSQFAPYIQLSATGKADLYTIYDNNFYFNKKWNDTYFLDIRFQFKPVKIQENYDVVDLWDVDPILIPLTTSYTWMMLEQPENAKIWFDVANKNSRSYGIDLNTIPNQSTYTHAANVGSRSPAGGRIPADYINNPFVRGMR